MTDYKQLCAELLRAMDEIEECEAVDWSLVKTKPLKMANQTMAEARTALDEPEPQRRYLYSPSQIAECGGPCQQGPEYCDCGELWVTEPELKGPTRDEAVAIYSEVMVAHDCQTLGDMAEHFAYAILARWGK